MVWTDKQNPTIFFSDEDYQRGIALYIDDIQKGEYKLKYQKTIFSCNRLYTSMVKVVYGSKPTKKYVNLYLYFNDKIIIVSTLWLLDLSEENNTHKCTYMNIIYKIYYNSNAFGSFLKFFLHTLPWQ